eukprot:2584523-Alexandrium_andersonii.AAC.1
MPASCLRCVISAPRPPARLCSSDVHGALSGRARLKHTDEGMSSQDGLPAFGELFAGVGGFSLAWGACK